MTSKAPKSTSKSASLPGASLPAPKSLQGHTIPPDRMALIVPHVALLAETALAVNDTLPLQADASDYARVLDEEAR